MEKITINSRETQRLGREIGAKLKGGEVLALQGDLGAGKTTFIQGLAKGLGIKKTIVSPTFIIVRRYPVSGRRHLYHVDLYRLEEEIGKELENLGLTDEWGRKENIVVIEWADKARNEIPKSAIWIEFEYVDEHKRKIKTDII